MAKKHLFDVQIVDFDICAGASNFSGNPEKVLMWLFGALFLRGSEMGLLLWKEEISVAGTNNVGYCSVLVDQCGPMFWFDGIVCCGTSVCRNYDIVGRKRVKLDMKNSFVYFLVFDLFLQDSPLPCLLK
jgi:hypothetical protein